MSVRYLAGAASGATDAVLLVNLGTPSAPTPRAVRAYLGEFLHDHRVVDLSRWLWCPLLHGAILPLRSRPLARKYAAIWTPEGSPLLAISQRLAAVVGKRLPERTVRLAMRYGEPSIPAVLRELAGGGLRRLSVLPLYPQYSATTTASVFDAVQAELARWRRVPELHLLGDYHDDGLWLDALQAAIEGHWDTHGRPDRLLFSLHGIPQRYADAGDPYPQQCAAGMRALAARLGLAGDEWRLGYQSRFGREPWLQPYSDVLLKEWAGQGLRRVDVICPGFAADCLETLEEVQEQYAALFRAAGGGELHYIPALNDGPGHAAALAALVKRRVP
jgi:ferrochelatase